MKFNIGLIRGGLTLFNLTGLALLTYALLNMFGMIEEDQKTIRLADPADYAMPADAPRPVSNRYTSVIRDLYRKKPAPPVAPVQAQTEPELPVLDGGPLRDWSITGVILSEEGRKFATLQEKSANPVGTNVTGRRTATSSRLRGTSGRTSSRTTSSRGRTSSRSRTPSRLPAQSQSRTRYIEQGKQFRVDENTYEVVDITHTPKQVTYRHNGRSYTLQTEDVLDPVIDEVDGGLVLRGFSPEELEALGLGGNQIPGRGAQQPTGIPTDSRGAIKNGKGQDVSAGKSGTAKPGTTAGQTPPGRPNPQARPQPASRSGLGTPQNQRGRGQQVRPSTRGNGLSTETKEQKQSRKQLEATLGIDLEKDPEGAIRQLEGLNKRQQ